MVYFTLKLSFRPLIVHRAALLFLLFNKISDEMRYNCLNKIWQPNLICRHCVMHVYVYKAHTYTHTTKIMLEFKYYKWDDPYASYKFMQSAFFYCALCSLLIWALRGLLLLWLVLLLLLILVSCFYCCCFCSLSLVYIYVFHVAMKRNFAENFQLQFSISI